MLNIIVKLITNFIFLTLLVSPTFLILNLIASNHTLNLDPAKPVTHINVEKEIHPLIPQTRWGDLSACGEYFDEKLHYDLALSCVNENVWPDSPLPKDTLPRCFVIKASSADVFKMSDFNGIPIVGMFGEVGAIVGFYQPETKSIFVVENLDAAAIYRHELQHLFLHLHDPESGGGGHHQDIWRQCEPPYYESSVGVKIQSILEEENNKY